MEGRKGYGLGSRGEVSAAGCQSRVESHSREEQCSGHMGDHTKSEAGARLHRTQQVKVLDSGSQLQMRELKPQNHQKSSV